MYTCFVSPTHVMAVQTGANIVKDALGGGAMEFRRQWTRPLKKWQLTVPGQAEKIDPLGGLLDVVQGDVPVWFDGAGAIEVTEPIIIGIGNGTITDFMLPHRHVYVSSMLVYVNGGAATNWFGLTGDGITTDTIRFLTAPGQYSQIKAKYKRRCKVVVSFDDTVEKNRAFRDSNYPGQSVYEQRVVLQEVPV